MELPLAPISDKQEHYRKTFADVLLKLNPAQRSAVETIEGPVLVIAGPGTGKTQIIAARIGHILTETDSKPENILCLTYTDAGTIAMRKRLFDFIGPDAYRVNIFTFHAFCNTVIQDNLDLFGLRNLDLISELEEILLYRELIDGFSPKHPLKRWKDPYYEIRRLKRLFQLMKTEDWSHEFIAAKADEYVEDLPNREEFRYKTSNRNRDIKKGDLNKNKVNKEIERMEQLKAAAREFPNYLRMMQGRKRYDYDDMILWVLNEFKANPDLLLTYQERYHYFLVDEYQDTNGSQNEILQLLINYWESPNVFVVGDEDQSIYRFQGANVANILDFYQRYREHLKVVVMDGNYRSSQNILNVSKALIEKNQERLVEQLKHEGLSKDLKAVNPRVSESTIIPVIREYYNTYHETVHIAKEIEALKDAGEDMSEVAVIYRAHKQSDDIARYLESKGIAINIKRKANIFESPFIGKILTILHYILGESKNSHSKEHLLFEILHFDFFNIKPLVIAELAVAIRPKGKKERGFWRDEIHNVSNRTSLDLFNSENNASYEHIRDLSMNLEFWIKEVHNITVQVLVEKIITRGGILKYIMDSPDKIWLMQELTTFFDFIKQENIKKVGFKLLDLIKAIQLMQEHEIALPINKISFADKGVNFITAHSSKGLEFENVFLIGSNRNDWDKSARRGTYSFPDNLVTRLEGDDVEESRRLFYVALTRAKQHLWVSYAASDREMKELEKSRFVAEIAEQSEIQTQSISLKDEDLLDYNLNILNDKGLPDLPVVDERHMKSVLEGYSLSVTHLNTYLKCPVSYYFKYILRVPSSKDPHMAFGSAMHVAVEQFFRKMNEGDKQFPPVDTLFETFEWYMNRHHDSFTDDELRNRLAYGRELLPKYYQEYIDQWNRVVTIERHFRNSVVKGVPINGKLDKIEFDGSDANVVDYKTGKFSNAKKKLGPPVSSPRGETPTFEEQYGGDYWRQAIFYKILVESDPSIDWNVISSEFDFMEPDDKSGKFNKYRVPIIPEDIETVTQQITETYQNIMNFEFDQRCEDKYCRWCNFTKTHYEHISEGHEEDDSDL